MKKRLKDSSGFTLIELILVIAVLGILAVTAFPNFFTSPITAARQNSRDAVVGAVQAGLSAYAASQVSQGLSESYPAYLETTNLANHTAASRTVPLFSAVLKDGVSSQWFKVDADCYAYDSNGNNVYNDGTDVEYQYLNTVGTFLGVADCGN